MDENLLEAVLTVHLNMSCILCVLSSSSYVNIGAFNQLVKETSIFLGEKFPWVMLNFTLHQFQHAGQLMEENSSRGLGELSEEALEANNKDMRVFMESYSRKTSAYQQLEDTLGRCLKWSDCHIHKEIHRLRPESEYSSCGKISYIMMSCKKNLSTISNEYGSLV